MCGIIAYIGDKPATPRLIEGLRRVEYRGYDSAGVAVLGEDGIWLRKSTGRVEELARLVGEGTKGTVGMAHTRWATHGGVTVQNAHPHLDVTGRIAVVHNGIIENMHGLKAKLQADGVVFRSETDTEILPHLIRRYYEGDPLNAVLRALEDVRGTYGIGVLFADHPDVIIAARNGSPLVVGLGDGETVLGSDPQAIIAHTRRVIYLDDREVAVLTRDGCQVHKLDGRKVAQRLQINGTEFSQLEVTIKTGRTHQIRVHLASEGFPIAGDDKYGDFELNKTLQKQGLKRMYLHAWRLQFNHPATSERIELLAALPADLMAPEPSHRSL